MHSHKSNQGSLGRLDSPLRTWVRFSIKNSEPMLQTRGLRIVKDFHLNPIADLQSGVLGNLDNRCGGTMEKSRGHSKVPLLPRATCDGNLESKVSKGLRKGHRKVWRDPVMRTN
jgi:hypothetical protein